MYYCVLLCITMSLTVLSALCVNVPCCNTVYYCVLLCLTLYCQLFELMLLVVLLCASASSDFTALYKLFYLLTYVCITVYSLLCLSLYCQLVGRVQLYRLSLVDAHTVAQNQYTGKFATCKTVNCHAMSWA